MPHASYTHEVIQLTDGRCYCLACDEVVAEEYLSAGGEPAVDPGTGAEPSRRPTDGD